MHSFNEIRQIVLEKMLDLDNKISASTHRLDVVDQQIVDVCQKCEQFQELFATIINEMQSASDDANEDKQSKSGFHHQHIMVKRISPELDDVKRDAMSTQMSQAATPMKPEGSHLRIDGGASSFSQSLNNSPMNRSQHPLRTQEKSIKE
jgi:hypothetical protein